MKNWTGQTKTVFICGIIFLIMVFLTATSPLIYNYICRVTGISGTPSIGEAKENMVIVDQNMTVYFDVTVDSALPWIVKPENKEITLKLGEIKTIKYHVENTSDKEITAMAVYNVQPDTMGGYFNKINCFCFEKQTLKPKEKTDFTLVFYVDPEMLKEITVRDLKQMTLSYTFYEADK